MKAQPAAGSREATILSLIDQLLKAGIMEGGQITESESGSPQGGVISLLLANIHLKDLGYRMARTGRKVICYADDLVILCPSQEILAVVVLWPGVPVLFRAEVQPAGSLHGNPVHRHVHCA